MALIRTSGGANSAPKEYTTTTITQALSLDFETGDIIATKPNATNDEVRINGTESSGAQAITGLTCLSKGVVYGNAVWICDTAGTYNITCARYDASSTIVHPVQ